MSQELQTVPAGVPMELTSKQVMDQVQLIQEVMHDAMKEGEHYGKIPGCGDKPALLKAGAEKLSLTFRLSPSYKIERLDLPNGHREYIIICELRHIETGKLLGAGVGSCSTMESKYRWRTTDAFEVTDLPIPRDAKEKKAEYRKQGFGMKKIDGEWRWVKFTGDGQKVENPDIADQYNTVLKMGKKRAQVDATLTALAASDIFTQDIEERLEGHEPVMTQATVVESTPSTGPDLADIMAKAKKYAEECETIEELRALKDEMVAKGRPYWSSETKAIIADRHTVLTKLKEQNDELNSGMQSAQGAR